MSLLSLLSSFASSQILHFYILNVIRFPCLTLKKNFLNFLSTPHVCFLQVLVLVVVGVTHLLAGVGVGEVGVGEADAASNGWSDALDLSVSPHSPT